MVEGRDALVPEYAVPPNTHYCVVIAVDGEQDRVISISDKPCYFLGRNPSSCDIPVEIRAASRVHCCLAHDSDGKVHLVDLNSIHGTQLEGVELGSDQLPLDVVLKPGAPFHLAGDKSITFQLQPAEAVRAAPSGANRAPLLGTDGSGVAATSPASAFPPKPSSLSPSPSPSRSPPNGGGPLGEDGELEEGGVRSGRSPGSMEPGERRSPAKERRPRRGEAPPREGSPGLHQQQGGGRGVSPPRRSRDHGRWREGDGEWEVVGRGRRHPGAPEFMERGGPEGGPPGRREGSPAMRPSFGRDGRRPFPPDRRPGPPTFDRRGGFPPPFPGGGRGGRFPPPDRRGMEPPGPRGRLPFRGGSPDYDGPMGAHRGPPPPRRGSPDYTDAGPYGRGPPPRRGSPDYTDAGPSGRGQRRPLSPDGADPGPPPRRRRLPSPPMDRPPPRRGPPPPPYAREDRPPPPHLGPRGGPRGGPGEGPRDRPREPPGRRHSRSPPRYGRERSRHSRSPPRGGRRGASGGPSDRSPPPRLPEQPAPPQQPAVASNPADAAALVRQMMGGGGAAAAGGSGLSVDQKKKLLWGGKKAETQVAPPQARYGSNRWDAAEFQSEEDKQKFIKLMGVKGGEAPLGPQPAPGPTPPGGGAFNPLDAGGGESQAHVIMKRDEQERLLGQLEKDFQSGVRRLGNRTQGLGL